MLYLSHSNPLKRWLLAVLLRLRGILHLDDVGRLDLPPDGGGGGGEIHEAQIQLQLRVRQGLASLADVFYVVSFITHLKNKRLVQACKLLASGFIL